MRVVMFGMLILAGVLLLSGADARAMPESQSRVISVEVMDGQAVLETDHGRFVSPLGMDLREVNALKEYAGELAESGESVTIRYREEQQGTETERFIVEIVSARLGRYLVDAESAAMDGVGDFQADDSRDRPQEAGDGLLPGAIVTLEVQVIAVGRENGLLVLNTDAGLVEVDAGGDDALLQTVEEAATLAMMQGDPLSMELEVLAGSAEGARYAARKVTGPDMAEVVLPTGM